MAQITERLHVVADVESSGERVAAPATAAS
jgi:hypothetical protein